MINDENKMQTYNSKIQLNMPESMRLRGPVRAPLYAMMGSSKFNLILKIFNAEGEVKNNIELPAGRIDCNIILDNLDYIKLYDEDGTELAFTPEVLHKYELDFSIRQILR